jgi:hypothetical protein
MRERTRIKEREKEKNQEDSKDRGSRHIQRNEKCERDQVSEAEKLTLSKGETGYLQTYLKY